MTTHDPTGVDRSGADLPGADHAPAGLREAKKARTRASLARAALQLVAEDGMQTTTVEAIAARAEVSPRTFFNYFDSKDDAVVHLSTDRFRCLLSSLFADDGELSANPVLQIRDVMLRFLGEADPGTASDDELMRSALERDPSLFGALHASMNTIGAEFEAAIASRYATVRDQELARVGLSVALGLTQTAMLDARDGRSQAPIADRVAHYFDLLESALAPRSPFTKGTTS
ncbi:TetR/AcrR family transcriptional regulator [Rhodococcus sp. IEGM 1408]|uniref:TetR/AcrR family transcriptional regulator n=1 Tax=Rhodococcus sp. IEGM 1408 TaxID=3082220 RepID=UPI0029554366|nr:TetR/AcrR family transcriptional regulator [Rhodococcus sp. IEGM 1408]MDV8002005.1 TetR/AcrR family transcriptional regulator [Rhodococcus sp. IEGM 1408]